MKKLMFLIVTAIICIMILQGSAEAANCKPHWKRDAHGEERYWCETLQCPNPCEGRVRIIDGRASFYCYCPE